MNKKLIIACSVCLLAIASFTIYNVINNNKVEKEQTAMANDMQADKEIEATPVANEKNDAGEYVNGEPDVAIQVKDFFDRCIQYTFNVPDTTKIDNQITDFQKVNFSEDFIKIINNFYKTYKSIELVDYKVERISKTTTGYSIEYVANLKLDDKTDVLENDEGTKKATALVTFENNKIKLEQFTTSKNN